MNRLNSMNETELNHLRPMMRSENHSFVSCDVLRFNLPHQLNRAIGLATSAGHYDLASKLCDIAKEVQEREAKAIAESPKMTPELAKAQFGA